MPPELALLDQFGNDVGVTASLRSPFHRPERRQPEPVETSYVLHLDVGEPNRVLERVEASLPRLAAVEIAEQVRQLTARLREAGARLDLSSLPPLRLTEADDGSVLIEWTLSDRRLGFNLESDPAQSGWYFATSPAAGGEMASGALAIADLGRLIRWALIGA